MERNSVILVDVFNNPIGKMEKQEAHNTPNLHRAFSVFLVNSKNEILIQKRADTKYHSPGLWANACCSHPQNYDENILVSAKNRLEEELGISGVKLEQLFSFVYFAKLDEHLYEYEHDSVLIGRYDGEVILDPSEASECEWISPIRLADELKNNPQKFAVWFLSCAPRVLDMINNIG